MTEKEKAKLGLLYDNNNDPDILQERMDCQKRCREYNDMPCDDQEGRAEKIKEIVACIGKDSYVEQPFRCDCGYNIEIGDNFYSNYNLVILDAATVKIGNHVFIGPDCGIYATEHPFNVTQRNAGLEYAYPITIGNNVWIGGGVRILSGVSIGDNTVIGAGSVVTKDIPSGVVAVGNPCRVIRRIDEKDLV